jgi:tRNA nucleotidyltransferase (CCA-adding enzyme)
MGYPLYAVGGFARDLLLGEPNVDIDLVVEGDAIKLAQALAGRLGGRVRSHRRFGTAKWILPERLGASEGDASTGAGEAPPGGAAAGRDALPDSLDFVSARTEFYERPTALPTVERSGIKQDLHRRDFTINTLAIRLTPDRWGEMLDFYGGRKDLEDGVIRVLHSLSFVEDPTRILRAARFEQRFGFRIEPRTEELIADARDMLDRVSAERVRHELELIMSEVEPEKALCRLDEMGVLPVLHPELHCDAWLEEKSRELRALLEAVRHSDGEFPPPMEIALDAGPRLHMALLTHNLAAEALAMFVGKFHIRKEYRDLQEELVRLQPRLERLGRHHLRPSGVVAVLEDSSDEARLLARVISESWLVRQRLDLYQRKLRHVRPLVTGDDLRRMGIQPGRIYREILDRLRAAQLDGDISTREEEAAIIREMLAPRP